MMDPRDGMRTKAGCAPNMIAEGFPDMMRGESGLRLDAMRRVIETGLREITDRLRAEAKWRS